MSTTYLTDVLWRFAIEHGHARWHDGLWQMDLAPSGKILSDLTAVEERALLATWAVEDKCEHGDRAPAVCGEARRLLSGKRCPGACCAEYSGFMGTCGDGGCTEDSCTNVACPTCWPAACPECGDAAAGHTDGGCVVLPTAIADQIEELTRRARPLAQKHARDGRLFEQVRTELIEDPELRGPRGAKKRIQVAALAVSREKAADELDAIAERVGTLRAEHRCKCRRSAAGARESKGHRWNEQGGLIEHPTDAAA